LRNNCTKFHADIADPIWNDGALGFLKSVRNKNKIEQQDE